MSDTLENLRRKINGAGELASVVRTMKAVAGSSIEQYENAVSALADYDRTVELGLSVCFRQNMPPSGGGSRRIGTEGTNAVVFGTDQGLVGQFNDVLASLATTALTAMPGKKQVWTVGERMHSAMADSGLPLAGQFDLPNSVAAITPLVGQIVLTIEKARQLDESSQLFLFHNRPQIGAVYEPASMRLLPLDKQWQREKADLPWPTKQLPELMGDIEAALIREYLFISLFRACAESLASENASRLAAMQRAEKNISDLQEKLNQSFHRLRQSSIDEELFDVIAGYDALNGPKAIPTLHN